MAPLGIAGLSLVTASSLNIRAALTPWALYHLGKSATDPTWTWHMFDWEVIAVSPKCVTLAVIDDQGVLEGLVALSKKPDRVKIEFLSTAPWNLGPQKKRKGIGPALIAEAIEISKTLGFGGALTLSSLKTSETFYVALGFTRTGAVDREGLAIFDLDPAQATVIRNGTPTFSSGATP